MPVKNIIAESVTARHSDQNRTGA